MKRSRSEKIFEAERQLQKNSTGALHRELETLRRDRERSLEPEGYGPLIAKIESRLANLQENPRDKILLDYHAYLLHEKDGRSYQQIGDQLYKKETKQARRSWAQRAVKRADLRLESGPQDDPLAYAINTARISDGRVFPIGKRSQTKIAKSQTTSPTAPATGPSD